MMRRAHRTTRAFTVVEMLVTIGIFVLVAVGAAGQLGRQDLRAVHLAHGADRGARALEALGQGRQQRGVGVAPGPLLAGLDAQGAAGVGRAEEVRHPQLLEQRAGPAQQSPSVVSLPQHGRHPSRRERPIRGRTGERSETP